MKSNLFSRFNPVKFGTLLLAFIILCSCPLDISAKNRKSGKKGAVKKEKVITKTTKQTSKPAEETLYTSACYEGDLLYRNEEFHSKAIRMMSGGMSYNGNRSVLLTLCEEGVRISDLDMHIHTVITPVENMCFVYSDLLDYGYVLTMEQIKQLYSTLDLEYSLFPDDPEFKKNGAFNVAQEKIEYLGDSCSIIKGKINTGDSNETETEMWIYDCAVPDTYKFFTYGYNPNGIVKKMILNVRIDLPLLGNVKSMVACELVAVEERPVDIEELFPPQSMKIKPLKDVGKLNGYYKAVNKELKKRKLKPKTKKAKEVKRNIQAKWDFADDWLNTTLHSQEADNVEKELSESLTTLLNSFASPGTNNNNNVSVATPDEDNASKRGDKESNKKEMIYIPDLIKEIESSISPMKAEVDNYEEACNYNASHSRKKQVRIGSKYIYVSEVTGMRKPVLSNKIEYLSEKSVVSDTRKIIDLVIQYGKNNNTDYISRERYNKISKAVYDASLKNLKMATKSARERKLRNFRKFYNHSASMLSSSYYFDDDRDFKWIEKVQRSMKELRLECGCDKSPWEDWDGITNPTE